ncbi:MAG: glycine zipper domain-containing protein [bacterium]|nr:glycine zipper domain-containing protein [bacterium]
MSNSRFRSMFATPFRSRRWLVVYAAVLAMGSPLLAQSGTQNGATAGGLAGAIIGGIVGHQNDEVPEGILIGGAVGAVTGGLLGKAHDRELERQRYMQQQVYNQQQQDYYRQQQAITRTGVSTQDVVNMSRSGLSETLIISQLEARGVQRRLEVSEIIALHQQGVSDNIIAAMQRAPLATDLVPARTIASPTSNRTTTVVVEEPVIYSPAPVVVERVYHPVPRHYHYRPHYHRGTYFGFGF